MSARAEAGSSSRREFVGRMAAAAGALALAPACHAADAGGPRRSKFQERLLGPI